MEYVPLESRDNESHNEGMSHGKRILRNVKSAFGKVATASVVTLSGHVAMAQKSGVEVNQEGYNNAIVTAETQSEETMRGMLKQTSVVLESMFKKELENAGYSRVSVYFRKNIESERKIVVIQLIHKDSNGKNHSIIFDVSEEVSIDNGKMIGKCGEILTNFF